MPAIIHQNQIIGQATNAEALVKDTVGWTGKNLLNITTVGGSSNGITWVVNSDKSISVYGTATGRVDIMLLTLSRIKSDFLPLVGETLIVNGCPQGGAIPNGYWISVQGLETDGIGANDVGNGATFTVHDFSNYATVGMRISVASGVNMGTQSNPKVFYPMIRKADITDPTYEPYHESVEVMYEEEIHGVNLFNNAQSISGNNAYGLATATSNGIKVTNSTASAWSNVSYNLRLKKNTTYRYSFNTTITSGNSGILIRGSLDGGATFTTIEDSGGGVSNYDVTFNSGSYDIIRLTFYCTRGTSTTGSVTYNNVMLRKADIEDNTYRPYNPQAIQNQLNAQGVLGAKNLLQYPYNNNSKTDSGVTFTVNSDGTIVANGTAAKDIYFNLVDTGIKSVLTPLKPNTKYIISGCEGGNNLTYRIWHPLRKSGGGYNGYSQMSEPIEYITPSDLSTYAVTIVIASGATVNNVKFKPMIRLASDPDDTYQPYAMTNRELTEEKINIADLKTVVSASSDFADFKTRIASL